MEIPWYSLLVCAGSLPACVVVVVFRAFLIGDIIVFGLCCHVFAQTLLLLRRSECAALKVKADRRQSITLGLSSTRIPLRYWEPFLFFCWQFFLRKKYYQLSVYYCHILINKVCSFFVLPVFTWHLEFNNQSNAFLNSRAKMVLYLRQHIFSEYAGSK